jgi:hypothetical protein
MSFIHLKFYLFFSVHIGTIRYLVLHVFPFALIWEYNTYPEADDGGFP